MSPYEWWHMAPRNGPMAPPRTWNWVTCVLYHIINHITTSLLMSVSLSALKTNRMLPCGLLEERQKGLSGLILQAIPLLMNFILPQRYNTLSKIGPHTVFRVHNTANLSFTECQYHHTNIMPHGREIKGVDCSYFALISFVFCFPDPLTMHHFISLLAVYRHL